MVESELFGQEYQREDEWDDAPAGRDGDDDGNVSDAERAKVRDPGDGSSDSSQDGKEDGTGIEDWGFFEK